MYNVISSRSGPKDADLTVPLDGTNGTGPIDTKSGNPIGVGDEEVGSQCPDHQFALEVTDSTTGTIAVLAKALGKLLPEPVQARNEVTGLLEDLVIDLDDAGEPATRDIEGNSILEFVFQPTGLDGTGFFTATIVSGD